MDDDQFDRLRRLSIELTNNNVLLPVAAALLNVPDGSTATAPSVSRTLQGRLPVNRILDMLCRLARLGVLQELPYPGKPHPRVFSRVQGPFWTFISAWVSDESVDCATDR
jgi:hypothetical protein